MIHRSVRILLSLVFIAAACTCGDKGRATHSFRIYTEDGITIAESSGVPKYTGELFQYEEVLRLNQDENVVASLLTQPRFVLMDENSVFYVEDNGSNRIACFDASGHYSHDIGQQGEGPGEYRIPRLQSVQEGVIVIRDSRLNRIMRFRTDGTFINSFSLPHTGFSPWRFSFGPDEELILLGDDQRGFNNEYRYVTAAAMVLSADGDTLASVVSDSVKTMYFSGAPNTLVVAGVYFISNPRVLYHPVHGLVMTSGIEPVFECYGLDGRLRRKIRLDVPPEPVTAAEREAVRSYLRDWISQAESESSRLTRQKQLELSEFQDPKACFSIRFIDEYGYLWAIRPHVEYRRMPNGEPPAGYLVFSTEGEYLGDTDPPVPFPQFLRGHIAGIEEDEETGAMEIIIYALRPLAAGFRYP